MKKKKPKHFLLKIIFNYYFISNTLEWGLLLLLWDLESMVDKSALLTGFCAVAQYRSGSSVDSFQVDFLLGMELKLVMPSRWGNWEETWRVGDTWPDPRSVNVHSQRQSVEVSSFVSSFVSDFLHIHWLLEVERTFISSVVSFHELSNLNPEWFSSPPKAAQWVRSRAG